MDVTGIPGGRPTECDGGVLEKVNMNRREDYTERARLSQVEEMKEETFQDSREAWEVGMLPPAVWTNTQSGSLGQSGGSGRRTAKARPLCRRPRRPA